MEVKNERIIANRNYDEFRADSTDRTNNFIKKMRRRNRLLKAAVAKLTTWVERMKQTHRGPKGRVGPRGYRGPVRHIVLQP
jgi:hypothetical protein